VPSGAQSLFRVPSTGERGTAQPTYLAATPGLYRDGGII
jgi:hypothetical protein